MPEPTIGRSVKEALTMGDRAEFDAWKSDMESKWPGLTITISDEAEKWKQEGRQELLDELGFNAPASNEPAEYGDRIANQQAEAHAKTDLVFGGHKGPSTTGEK